MTEITIIILSLKLFCIVYILIQIENTMYINMEEGILIIDCFRNIHKIVI
jgi:hypothetical protein